MLALAALLAGCSDDLECVEVSSSCAALYPPTFDDIFSRTLQPTCAAGGSSCHAPAGGQGGLSFVDADQSHAALLAEGDDGPRVTPGDASCSLLMMRLESSDEDFQMPPGSPLSAEERCVFVQWIAAGAKR
jgi:hypothetical protein